MSEEDIQPMAPGLLQAYAPEEADEMPDPRRRRRNQDDPIANLRKWEPRTRPVSYTHLTLPTTVRV